MEKIKDTNMKRAEIILSWIILTVNFTALAGGIAYLFKPMQYMLWNAYGYVILLALFGNIIFACTGTKYRYLDYGYLLLNMIGMLLIPVLNTLASSDVQNKTSQSLFSFFLFFAIFLYGAVSAGFQIMHQIRNFGLICETKNQLQSGRVKNVMRWIVVSFLLIWLLIGFYISYIMLGRTEGNLIEMLFSEYAVFWGLLVLGAAAFILRLRWRNKKCAFNISVLAAGLLVFAICMLPLASVPFMIRNADNDFIEAFGGKYEAKGFMKKPFSLQDYFFSIRTKDYTIKENVLFYAGTGKDKGLRLHFDAFMPAGNGSSLPGQNSVLIRIHGGAWVVGDKGIQNYSSINKHFANQGYVVFDIQYGLYDRKDFISSIVPETKKGDFDIDDMVRHIGIFTKYLAVHADEYGANLDSVFISGASAGGQLATAAALGILSGKYTDILDERLNVKGLIPYYPGYGLSHKIGISGDPDLVDPTALVDKNSPPCLIFHGTHDGVVPPEIAVRFQQAYMDKSSSPCALLWMTLSGHGSDFYTPGYYNQVFSYYMERFMYQFR